MLRSLRNLVLWKVPLYTLSFTVLLISIGIMFLFIDWITLTQRMLKLFLFMFCGPWMHFFDRYFFQKYYKTEDELRATKTYYEPRLEDLFETERFRSLRKMVLVAFEDAVKVSRLLSSFLTNFFLQSITFMYIQLIYYNVSFALHTTVKSNETLYFWKVFRSNPIV